MAALLSAICLFIVFGGTYVPEATTFVLLACRIHTQNELGTVNLRATDLGSVIAGGYGCGRRSYNQLFDRGGVNTLSVEGGGQTV